jgi:putative Mn2+ efflux pump MntP
VSSWTVLVLAFGLAMDATAVAASRGLASRSVGWRQALIVAVFFGGSQALMPLIGYAVGSRFGAAVAAWDHWIAFVLLGIIGGKMLWESRGAHDDDKPRAETNLFALPAMAVLAVATSIDALAVGTTLPMLNAPLTVSIATIGVVTAILSALGLFAGRKFGAALGPRLDAVGGVVLIGIGTKILVEHLSTA